MTWPESVLQPLGLVAFVLFLVFTYAAKHTAEDTRWMRPLIYFLACGALLGGFVLAFLPKLKEIFPEAFDFVKVSPSVPVIEPPQPVQDIPLPVVPPTAQDLVDAIRISTGNEIISQVEVEGETHNNYQKKIWLELPSQKRRAIKSVTYYFASFDDKEKEGKFGKGRFEARWIGWGCSHKMKVIAELHNGESVTGDFDGCELDATMGK